MKQELRKEVLAARDAMTAADRAAKSSEIADRLFRLPEIQTSAVILFFASFRSEVDTVPMIRKALSLGKRVVLPKVQGKELGLFEIRDYDRDVTPGAWGIPEPSRSLPVKPAQIDAIIIPGAAFDERGSRLGYGAGFYDKLLPACNKTTVALAFELQIVSSVPVGSHDVPVGKIVTEKRVITTRKA